MKGLRSLIPFLAGLVAALLLLLIGSPHPDQALKAFFVTPFIRAFNLGNMLDQASLILVCALGFLLCMRMGIFNLGGEGFSYIGALTAAEVGIACAVLPGPVGILIAGIASFCAAAILGAFAGLLRRIIGISELISTFLLSGAIIPLVDFAISGPLRNTKSNLLATPFIPTVQWLPGMLAPSTLNISIFLSLGLAVLLTFVLARTRIGYELKLLGDTPEFARSHGIRAGKFTIIGLSIGSGLAGLAGAMTVFGSQHAAFTGITAGLGWNGIAAALIGRTNPLGAVGGALIFAWLGAGAKAAMVYTDFTFEFAAIIQGLVFLLVGIKTLPHLPNLFQLRKAKVNKEQP